ncbi:MAG: hypothetical protein ACFFBF_15810 [Promethearchaeota archaeon]
MSIENNNYQLEDFSKEFIINKYVTLRLKGEETVIYVGGREFRQCKFLLINIPVEKASFFDEIKSIDEASVKLDNSLEMLESIKVEIPHEVLFWGHCSNLQIWAEFGYDSRLLHSNLAFPLLKELLKFRDPQAKKVFKDEIFKRFSSGLRVTQEYLIERKYLDYLTSEEREALFRTAPIDKDIKRRVRNYRGVVNLFIYCPSYNPKFTNAISYIRLNKFGFNIYYGCIFMDNEIYGFTFVKLQNGRITDFYIIYDGNRMYIDQEADYIYSLKTHRLLRVDSLDYFSLERCEEMITNFFELIPTSDKYAGHYQLDFGILNTAFKSFLDEEGNKNYFLKTDQFDFEIIEYIKQSKFFKKKYFHSEYGNHLSNVLRHWFKIS